VAELHITPNYRRRSAEHADTITDKERRISLSVGLFNAAIDEVEPVNVAALVCGSESHNDRLWNMAVQFGQVELNEI
jgi:hypothetical protein